MTRNTPTFYPRPPRRSHFGNISVRRNFSVELVRVGDPRFPLRIVYRVSVRAAARVGVVLGGASVLGVLIFLATPFNLSALVSQIGP